MKEAKRSHGKTRKGAKGRPRLTKAEAQAYVRRWSAVNRAEIEELRRRTPNEKLRQLVTMMEAADALGWSKALEAEEAEVRKQWARLRRALRVF